MVKWGMVIDLDKCVACGACVVACKQQNNVHPSFEEEYDSFRVARWMDLLVIKEGEYPDVYIQVIPRPCMQCEIPLCVKYCPVGATYKRNDGITMQDYNRCIGCRACMTGCPYDVRSFTWFDYSKLNLPSTLKLSQNPDIDPPPKGIVHKCIFCYPRLDKLKYYLEIGKAPKIIMSKVKNWEKEAELKGVNKLDYIWSKAINLLMSKLLERDDDQIEIQEHFWDDFELNDFQFLPACVQTCPARAIIFGDLSDPESLVSKLSKDTRAFRLLEDKGTKPSVIYLTSERRRIVRR
ncbi:MAG: 4Fe-4S dicluster domain-containing protein [Nitrososphaerales archaeon]